MLNINVIKKGALARIENHSYGVVLAADLSSPFTQNRSSSSPLEKEDEGSGGDFSFSVT